MTYVRPQAKSGPAFGDSASLPPAPRSLQPQDSKATEFSPLPFLPIYYFQWQPLGMGALQIKSASCQQLDGSNQAEGMGWDSFWPKFSFSWINASQFLSLGLSCQAPKWLFLTICPVAWSFLRRDLPNSHSAIMKSTFLSIWFLLFLGNLMA